MLSNMFGLKANHRPKSRLSSTRESSSGFEMFSQELFLKLLYLERKRTEHSGRRFVLMLLDPGNLLKATRAPGMTKLLSAIVSSTRDTDLTGWYKEGSIIGVIFTEVGGADDKSIVHALSLKLTDQLYGALSLQEINEVQLSFHVFPDDWDDDGSDGPVSSTLQMAIAGEINRNEDSLGVNRLMDMTGSIAGWILWLRVHSWSLAGSRQCQRYQGSLSDQEQLCLGFLPTY